MADLESVPEVPDGIVTNYTPGERIKLLRTYLNLNGSDFAELIGYSRSYVSMVEHGKLQVNKKFLESVSEATEVPVGWLSGAAVAGRDLAVAGDKNDDEMILTRAFQYTAEKRKAIRNRNLAEVKHPNGIPSMDLENLTEKERSEHQEMMQARGNRLRQLRREHAQSIKKCADTVPLSTSSVFQVECGKREMTKGLAKKLEKAYDVSSKWLLYGDELSKDWPCGEKMISFLERHPEVRKYVWEKMMEEERGQDVAGE